MIDRDLLYFRTLCVVFWITATFGFISQELLPPIAPLQSPLFLACDAVIAILGLTCLRGRKQIILFSAFWVIAFVSTILINHESWLTFINGSRNFFGMLFSLPICVYILNSPRWIQFKNALDQQLLIFLCLQAVCITEQFIRYGANDHGGGTMGNGSSGIASILIILTSFYFVIKQWDYNNFIRSLWKNKIYIFLLYPVLLNETKSSFVLIAVYFLLLYKFEFKSIGKMIIGLPIAFLFFIGIYNVYLNATGFNSDEVIEGDAISDYLGGGDDIEDLIEEAQMVQDGVFDDADAQSVFTLDLPRFAKFGLIPFILQDAPGNVVLGAGLGQYKGGTNLEYTKFREVNEWYLQGTVTTLLLFTIQLGVIGVIWYVVWMLYSLNLKSYKNMKTKKIKLFLGIVALFIMFYNDSFRVLTFNIIFFYYCVTTWNNRLKVSHHLTYESEAGHKLL